MDNSVEHLRKIGWQVKTQKNTRRNVLPFQYQKYFGRLACFPKSKCSHLEWNINISEIFCRLKRTIIFSIPPNSKCHHFSGLMISHSYFLSAIIRMYCGIEQVWAGRNRCKNSSSYCLSTWNWMVHWYHRLGAVIWNIAINYISN